MILRDYINLKRCDAHQPHRRSLQFCMGFCSIPIHKYVLTLYGQLKRTMHRIRQVLVDRHYARFDATLLTEEKLMVDIFPDLLQRVCPRIIFIELANDSSIYLMWNFPRVSKCTKIHQLLKVIRRTLGSLERTRPDPPACSKWGSMPNVKKCRNRFSTQRKVIDMSSGQAQHRQCRTICRTNIRYSNTSLLNLTYAYFFWQCNDTHNLDGDGFDPHAWR